MARKAASAPKIKYVHGNQNMLSQIKALWEALNQYHCQRSAHFKRHYFGMTFEKRKFDLLKKAEGGEMHVDIEVDEATGQGVGYLISTLTAEKTGEIDSIYVEAAFRGMGIGDSLVRDALAWMDQNGATEKIVEVSIGNEQAWGFYGRYGFLPRKTLLKQVKKT